MFKYILPLIFLTACATSAVAPQQSGIPVAPQWNYLAMRPDAPLMMNSEAQVDQYWWHNFQDPTLDGLIAEALNNNKSLQIAKARVEEVRANRGVAQAALFPNVNLTGTEQHGNQGFATEDKTVSLAQANIEASWELDLFGRNQARTAQAEALLQSEEATQQGVRVALLAEIARNYFDLRNYERQIALTMANLQTEQKTLSLIQAQMKGALASDFDVQRAAAQVSTTEAMLPSLQTGYDAARNRLNVLLGFPPGTRDSVLNMPVPQAPLDHRILIAAPAWVLAMRPDVRVAERNFAASISASRAAEADLFPNISLTALFGAQAASPFSSLPWGLAANLTQPLLNFGRVESQIDAANARQKQAFLNYQQTILEALENMENALSAYMNETMRSASLTTAVAQNRKAAEQARLQYTNGYTGLLDVLVAERNVLEAEAAEAASQAALRKNLVNIYTAAGGGWAN